MTAQYKSSTAWRRLGSIALASLVPAEQSLRTFVIRSFSAGVAWRDRDDRKSRSTIAQSSSLRAIALAAILASERSFSLIVLPFARCNAWAIDGSADRSHEHVASRAGL